jgi:hypothetical protein
MPVYHKRNLLFIYCLDIYRAIVEDGLHFIGPQPSCSELSLEILESRIEEEGPVTRIEVLLFYKLVMPPSSLFLDKDSVLNGILSYFIQLIQLNHSLLLGL